jgi:hypothetical protein
VRAAILAAACGAALAAAACKGSSGGVDGGASTGAGGCMLLGNGSSGGGSSCLIEQDDCTNCVQSVCVTEAMGCGADPACAAANCVLLNCVCSTQDTRDVVGRLRCEAAFRGVGPPAAAAAACLEAQCAKLCGW